MYVRACEQAAVLMTRTWVDDRLIEAAANKHAGGNGRVPLDVVKCGGGVAILFGAGPRKRAQLPPPVLPGLATAAWCFCARLGVFASKYAAASPRLGVFARGLPPCGGQMVLFPRPCATRHH